MRVVGHEVRVVVGELGKLLVDFFWVELERRHRDGDRIVGGQLVIGLRRDHEGERERLAALERGGHLGHGRERRGDVALVDGERHKVFDGLLLHDGIEVLDAELLFGRLGHRAAGGDAQVHLLGETAMRHGERVAHFGGGCDSLKLDAAAVKLLLGHFHGGSPSVVRRRTAIVAQKRAGGARHACGGREREPNASRRMRPQVGGRAGWTARCAARWTARASARNAKEGGARAPCKLPAIFWPRNRVLARIEPVSAAWQLCRNRRPGLSPRRRARPKRKRAVVVRSSCQNAVSWPKNEGFPARASFGRSSRGAREGRACDRGRMWKRARGGRRAGGVTRST